MAENKLYKSIITFRDQVEKIFEQDYFNPSSVEAANGYKVFLKFMIDHFEEIEQSSYQLLFIFLNTELVSEIRYIERSSTKNIPWSLIPNLNKILTNEFGGKYALLFRPQWKFNYSVVTDDIFSVLRKILVFIFPHKIEDISKLFSDKKVYIFSFPYLEKNNVLLDSIIGHEIGHFIHNQWQQTKEYDEIILSANNELSRFYREANPKDLFAPYEKATIGIQILKGMYREILSDIVGYQIFGPSMLFALFYIAILENKIQLPTEHTNYYPITKYRIRVLFEQVAANDEEIKQLVAKNHESSDILREYFKEIEQYLAIRNDLEELSKVQTEINIFSKNIPSLIKLAQEKMSRKYLSTDEISQLYDKLSTQIPINEIDGKPIGMPSILLTGWLFHYKINKNYKRDQYIIRYQVLMRLLLKSLFSSHVHSRYIEK